MKFPPNQVKKVSILLPLTSLFFASNLLAYTSLRYGTTFEKGIPLKGDAYVRVNKLEERLKWNNTGWKSHVSMDMNYYCHYTLIIEGRDFATRTNTLGEHYYGSAIFDCNPEWDSSLRGGKAFKTIFSRVLFANIRNCTFSETAQDTDSCMLDVYGFRKESDLNFGNGDLLTMNAKKKEKYIITSMIPSKYIPLGLNMIDSTFSLGLMIDPVSKLFYAKSLLGSALMINSSGIPLHIDPQDSYLEYDQKVVASIDAKVAQIRNYLSQITSKESAQTVMAPTFSLLNQAAQEKVTIINPVDFYAKEVSLNSIQKQVIEVFQRFIPNIDQQLGRVTPEFN